LGDLHGLLGQVTGSESTKILENSIENAEADTQAFEQACR
jgi:hypothetical protein